ncbi:uncharacterized protein LTR77_003195 [Saxophila tyrrhenica]|uniref:Uncharacterized protein n=1 Tax=Saxophila tyrrhenica TaxID=1690608 RepID=A0AAV9PL84_9PEZI|nr:hypothetical protein LTR77_003195 [Saxophila tyrrhenica]
MSTSRYGWYLPPLERACPMKHLQTRLRDPSIYASEHYVAPWQQQIAERNAQASPLLRLPAEVRNLIYEYVLCNLVVHISVRDAVDEGRGCYNVEDYYDDPRRKPKPSDMMLTFANIICQLSPNAQDKAYELSKQPNPATSPVTYCLEHGPCYTNLSRLKFSSTSCDVVTSSHLRPLQLSLSCLRTCRQIHHEAHLLPYTDNAFAFHESETFNLFVRTLAPAQRAAINTIHIDGFIWSRKLLKALHIPAIRSLTGLRTLHFTASNLTAYLSPRTLSALNEGLRSDYRGVGRKALATDPVLAFRALPNPAIKFKVTHTCGTKELQHTADHARRRVEAEHWENLLTMCDMPIPALVSLKRKLKESDSGASTASKKKARVKKDVVKREGPKVS